ncbi:metallophosphatase family protein [Pedobacter sp. HMWF019]|uniref:metallophosphoesterase family protein n=1 Tax=Pedobacter sp. HMWF019 TaxID=2056856 RepID=UPI000D3D0906|nr:metallophosphoesterase family protein [Pedobacter sp. HMWF019]PTS94273.1 metallophosphatase family protein [Pedobacter sp. HMWF019]
MIKIAIFSDVHGNLPALEAVLEDIERKGADQIYCLGDLVDFAPWSNEVIDLIRKHKIPCLMGNHDERVAFDLDILPLAKHSEEETAARTLAIDHTKKILTQTNKDYLASLPRQIKLNFGKTHEPNLLLVHGSVRDNEEYIYDDHDTADLKQMLQIEQANVLVMGHTHLPYIRKILADENASPNLVLVNCGSVGRSKETGGLASYCMLTIDEEEIGAEIIRLQYQKEKTITAIRKSKIPDFYANFLNR